ncbi:class I SAM-dependent methyltransferase [Streptosporangium sp. NPDC050855]|uniref:class I SAM-dependent methyltransferase n=1 Tax=Streptosporangium sp. NPDC050855 TaxID=3366194 RepID=UPI0037BDF6EA
MFARRALSRVVYGSRYDRVPRNHRSYVRPGERLAREVQWRLRIGRTPVMRFQDYRERTLLERAEEFVTCRLCGETRQQPLFQRAGAGRGGSYRVVRCPACGLLYRNPALRPPTADVPHTDVLYADPLYADLLYALYADPSSADVPRADDGAAPDRTADRRRRRRRLTMDAFGPVFSSGRGRALLDVGHGAGDGIFLRLARERGFEAAGLDLAAGSVTAAVARLAVPGTRSGTAGVRAARTGPAGTGPAGTGPAGIGAAAGGFDVITLWSVLARLPRPMEDLRCLRGLLAPGGVMLILTANAASLQLKAYGNGWTGFRRNNLMFYSAETLVTLLSRTGFAGVAFAPFYGDDVEAGAVGLPGRMGRRLRRNVEAGGGKMIRALAFADRQAVHRWGERLRARRST